jgi:AraC family transcriptional activator of pyochelin receptor
MHHAFEIDVADLLNVLGARRIQSHAELLGPSEAIRTSTFYHLLDSDFVLAIQSLHFLLPASFRFARRNLITFQFTQSGSYRSLSGGQVRQVGSGTARLITASDSLSEFRQRTFIKGAAIFIRRDRLVDQFGLTPRMWREEFRNGFNDTRSSLSIEIPLTAEMWHIVDALIDCKFEEPVRSLYLAAKATELLVLTVVQFNSFARSGRTSALGQVGREQRLIETAALIYRSEISRPPSIESLTRRVGLNRNKLTGGFRAAFGVTPAEYSRGIRLDWAARRLSEGVDVGQVAVEVGYDSIAAFGRAFRQHHGYAPSLRLARQGLVL